MKKLLTLLAIGCISIATHAQDFKFEEELINYGKITKGSNGTRVFEFTNIGEAPLIIERVKSSCGCTIPKKPEQPIMPGEKGQIEVSYDTKRLGGFSKAITIFSNAREERKVIRIKGFITKQDKEVKEKATIPTGS